MRHRQQAAAALAALALGASFAGAAAVPAGASTAQAATASHRTAHRSAPVVVNVRVTKDGLTRSRTGFRPGNTIVNIRSAGGGGTVELVKLHRGYTVADLQKDFSTIFSGDVQAVRSIDRHVEMYGGSQVYRHRTASFATYLDRGRYLLANLDKGTVAWMRVAGKPQQRSLPRADGQINFVQDDRFGNPGVRHHSGWFRTTNRTDEPHFVDINHVKASTTRQQVQAYFDSGAQGQPAWALKEMAGTLVVGPGHTVLWRHDVPRGKYVEMCWWPSKDDGMPHAMMGMWALTRLR